MEPYLYGIGCRALVEEVEGRRGWGVRYRIRFFNVEPASAGRQVFSVECLIEVGIELC